MQYLLTEEEMEAIRQRRRIAEKMPDIEALGNVCKHVADTMITTQDVNGYGAGATTPYGCIHSTGPKYGYCDRCPVRGICPLPKEFSK